MSSAPSLRPATTSYFDLPHRLDAKTVPELIARDDEHFSAVARSLHRQAAELDGRLDALRQRAGSHGEAALERDTEIHRLTAQLRLLQRFDVDVCLGRMVFAGENEPVYIGRVGLAAEHGDRLLVDWRAPAAGHDLQGALDDEAGESASARADSIDRLVGPFAHIVIDEAQELTDAEWRVVLARCPSRSLTIVGDRAQARRGFAEEWTERLARVGLSQAAGDRVEISRLRVNYRTPAEIMAEAEPVIRAALPDANVPGSVREAGEPVRHASVTDLDRVLGEWLRTNSVGTACVIAPAERVSAVGGVASTGGATSTEADSSESVEEARVRVLTPESAKGLEADLVVLIDPTSWGEGIRGAVDRYVAMTRSTQQLVVLAGD
ncbi:MAG: hypothetical protein ACTHXF_06540 [Brevibacterium yomogidense]